MTTPLIPSTSLLVKLGSIAVHADEMSGYGFNQMDKAWIFDLNALHSLLIDPEVKEWIARMNKLAMLPVKR